MWRVVKQGRILPRLCWEVCPVRRVFAQLRFVGVRSAHSSQLRVGWLFNPPIIKRTGRSVPSTLRDTQRLVHRETSCFRASIRQQTSGFQALRTASPCVGVSLPSDRQGFVKRCNTRTGNGFSEACSSHCRCMTPAHSLRPQQANGPPQTAT